MITTHLLFLVFLTLWQQLHQVQVLVLLTFTTFLHFASLDFLVVFFTFPLPLCVAFAFNSDI
jgi:hypothetical protein